MNNEVRVLHGESSTGHASYVAVICFIRLFGSRRFFERAERKSSGTISSHPNPDGDADRFFSANPGRFETTATSGAEQRLCLPAGRAFGGQHRAALDRVGPGGEGRWVRRGRIESYRLRRAARESDGATLGTRRRNGEASSMAGPGGERDPIDCSVCARRNRRRT